MDDEVVVCVCATGKKDQHVHNYYALSDGLRSSYVGKLRPREVLEEQWGL